MALYDQYPTGQKYSLELMFAKFASAHSNLFSAGASSLN